MLIPITDYAAGAAATDLVNTSPTVRAHRGEALTGPEALAGFPTEHGLRPDALAGGLTEQDVFEVHLLRREVRGIMETETEEQAVAGAAALTRRAGLAPVLRRDGDGRWQWHVPTAPGASLADELAALAGIALFGVGRSPAARSPRSGTRHAERHGQTGAPQAAARSRSGRADQVGRHRGRVVSLAIAGVALYAAFGPASEDELRRSRFYADGSSVAIVLQNELLAFTRDDNTCEEGFEAIYRKGGPEWSKPQGDEDKQAFMLGCSEGRIR
ncbi:ABATE domain-containing protein [Nonomuraea indica]|uniref:ABATE domain-containing protein n=1 Tax=Nonomuraea indica TaxID=1581193 RepID=A0ABW8ADR0_9ACTN